ncbi:MAG: DNA repair protein RecO [Thioalkalispiraceae bacterium]|jgi:DNA repair protein RecO (recombination protein O)
MSKVELQHGYVLHARPYRDTSSLLEIFSRDYGRQSLVARGVRTSKSKLQGILQPFVPLLISWSGRGELHTLTHAEQSGRAFHLKANNLMIGFYLNELLIQFMHKDDPHADLFQRYQETLAALDAENDAEPLLRLFERDLLEQTGYGLILDCDVESGEALEADKLYAYYPERGPVAHTLPDENLLQVHGKTLMSLAGQRIEDKTVLPEAKRLMRYLIAWHMGGKPLKTRELFKQQL